MLKTIPTIFFHYPSPCSFCLSSQSKSGCQKGCRGYALRLCTEAVEHFPAFTQFNHLNYRNFYILWELPFCCLHFSNCAVPTPINPAVYRKSHSFSNDGMLRLCVPVCVCLYPMLNHFLRLQGKVLGEGGVQGNGCRTKLSWEREEKINTKVKPSKGVC